MSDPRSWGLARYLLANLGGFTALIFVPFFVVVMLVGLLIAGIWTLESSVWEAATVVIRIYVALITVHVVNTHFTLFLAHGGTRREYARQLLAFVVGHGALVAGLTTVGFWLESVVADLAGWAISPVSFAFFDSASQVLGIAATFFVLLTVWGAASALGAVSMYRSRDVGGFGVIAAVATVLLVEPLFGNGFRIFGFVTRLLDVDPGSLGSSVAVGGAFLLGTGLVTWLLLRTIAVRNPADG